jgi:hypothetical protein
MFMLLSCSVEMLENNGQRKCTRVQHPKWYTRMRMVQSELAHILAFYIRSVDFSRGISGPRDGDYEYACLLKCDAMCCECK